MRRLKLTMVIATLLLVAAVGCEKEAANPTEFDWSMLQSPLTGNCYEVLTDHLGLRDGVMAMAQIECP